MLQTPEVLTSPVQETIAPAEPTQTKEHTVQLFFSEVLAHFLSPEFKREQSGAVVVALAQNFLREVRDTENLYRTIEHHMGTLVTNLSFAFNMQAAEKTLLQLAEYWQTALNAQTAPADLEIALKRVGYTRQK